MKLNHIILAGLLGAAVPASFALDDTTPAAVVLNATEQAAVDALDTALKAATTDTEKQQALADAVAANTALSGVLQAFALDFGMSLDVVLAAITTGLGTTAAGSQTGGSSLSFSTPNTGANSGGVGGGTASGG
jgi:hypothetical protein